MNSNQSAPRFSSRLAMILTCMGMAVGTGNIWRFPREVASNGGGTFLIPWFIFLFLWSIPLLMVELSVGQHNRKGPYGAFLNMIGEKFSWMGGFISICTMLIMCYYAVVTGWTLRYVLFAFQGSLAGLDNTAAIALFDNFRSTPEALGWHVLAVFLAAFFVYKGAGGIERLNKVLIPMLVLILMIGAVKSLMMTGAGGGLDYLLTVDWERLADPKHWLAGLTQSAWSTGAGWGLMLAYAVYARDKEDPVTTPMATGAGNNSIELIVALMIFPALFAIMQAEAVTYVSSASSKGGIAFHVVPVLFESMPGGNFVRTLFFIGLASAALTSLVAMIELSVRFFADFNMPRKTAFVVTVTLCVVVGAPSALFDAVFDNQDFVWGVGLIVSGLFLAFMVLRFGVNRFRSEILNQNATWLKAGPWFNGLMVLVIVEGLALLIWWFIQAGQSFQIQFLVQWGLLIGILIALGGFLNKRMKGG
ncbi:MAG: sodium-dependent transporter [Acidobacteriota bacterium]|nr:sodium-dependent transporter [Acidobacteriota bacterium]